MTVSDYLDWNKQSGKTHPNGKQHCFPGWVLSCVKGGGELNSSSRLTLLPVCRSE